MKDKIESEARKYSELEKKKEIDGFQAFQEGIKKIEE